MCVFRHVINGKCQSVKSSRVSRYHHNVESSRSYYGEICTTHTYDDRAKTIVAAHEAGLEVCSGGIIGMGESMEQRLEMAFELREMGVHSVPINILNPIKGTGMANQPPLNQWKSCEYLPCSVLLCRTWGFVLLVAVK